MRKGKWNTIRDYIVKNCKIVFPLLLIVIVAVTVVIALNANKKKETRESLEASNSIEESTEPTSNPLEEDVPLASNDDSDIFDLLNEYYSALGEGNMDTVKNIYDEISEADLLYYAEQAKYIDHYSALEVFSKPGLTEATTVAYVYYKVCFVNREEEIPGYETFYLCRNDQDRLYIKNENSFTEEEKDYIKAVTEQEDVVEFNNRVNVEYNELMVENPELLEYLGILGEEVNTAVGVILAEHNAGNSEPEQIDEPVDEPVDASEGTTGSEVPEEPVDNGPRYAKATTTVNVRSSDSEKADKLGKLTSGSRVQVQEILVNGWTKIIYEGKDGFVKSEYLNMEEAVEGLEVIGKVTANTNINVREAASETAKRLGVLAGGESLELIANENGWCKVKYNGQIGYVKTDYVTQE